MVRAGDDVTLLLRRVFRASAEWLFDAWTDPALLARWFHAQPTWTTKVIEADLREGGAWEILMCADGVPTCRCFGRYREIDRPRRLVFTWLANEDLDYETTVTLMFKALDADTTELVLTQTGLRTAGDREEHEHGWDGCLASLVRLGEGRE